MTKLSATTRNLLASLAAQHDRIVRGEEQASTEPNHPTLSQVRARDYEHFGQTLRNLADRAILLAYLGDKQEVESLFVAIRPYFERAYPEDSGLIEDQRKSLIVSARACGIRT